MLSSGVTAEDMTREPAIGPVNAGEMLFRERVRERDLDNFLVEELHASPLFLEWVLERLADALDRPSGAASLRKSPPRELDRRQTDVRIGWFDDAGDLCDCVLIESKVTEDFQPGQAEAYASELAALRERLGHRRVASLLVAPRSKLAALAHSGAFDAEVALEEIVAFMEERRRGGLDAEIDARLEARVQLLEALCGKRPGSAWLGKTVQEKRDFAQAYSELAGTILPALTVRPSTDGPKAITRIFDGLDLPGLPRASLRHEFGSGSGWKYANILFAGASDRVEAFRRADLFDATPYVAEPAGKSLAIRVRTPAVDPMRPFEDEREAVEKGLHAIGELVGWVTARREALGELISPFSESVASLQKRVVSGLEAEFTERLRATYRECERLNYRPTEMLRMVEEHGGVEAARRLLTGMASEGLARLAMLGRLDLSIEAIVQEDRWHGLFTEHERLAARRRLR